MCEIISSTSNVRNVLLLYMNLIEYILFDRVTNPCLDTEYKTLKFSHIHDHCQIKFLPQEKFTEFTRYRFMIFLIKILRCVYVIIHFSRKSLERVTHTGYAKTYDIFSV